jgi:hypothetical protein
MDDYEQAAQVRRKNLRLGIAAGVGAVVLLCLCTCCVAGIAFRPGPSGVENKAAKDPYSPDCAIVRRWLRDNYSDAEVESWGQRAITRNPELGDHVTLSVRFRTKGRTKSAFFIIGAGDIVESATVTD